MGKPPWLYSQYGSHVFHIHPLPKVDTTARDITRGGATQALEEQAGLKLQLGFPVQLFLPEKSG